MKGLIVFVKYEKFEPWEKLTNIFSFFRFERPKKKFLDDEKTQVGKSLLDLEKNFFIFQKSKSSNFFRKTFFLTGQNFFSSDRLQTDKNLFFGKQQTFCL